MNTRSRGFTLIEMAVVLVIIGLLLTVSLPFFTEKISQERLVEGRENITALKREIIGFALTNGYLPTLTTVQGFANSQDAWDNPIAYWSDQDITDVGNDICGAVGAPNNLRVLDQGTTYQDIAFVIASRGQNANLQVNEDQGGGAPNPRIIEVFPFQTDTDEVNQDLGTQYDLGTDRDEPYDDIVEFVTFDYLYDRLGCGGEEGPIGADISFADDIQDFGGQDGQPFAASNNEIPTISLDLNAGEMTMQTEAGVTDNFGCSWYQGGNGNCGTSIGRATDDGVCQMGNGLRIFFRAKIRENSDGGFTLAVIGYDEGNGINDGAVGNLCGGTCGYLGYAETFTGAVGLYPPKLGVVFDLFGSTGGDYFDVDSFGTPTDNEHNHMSLVYWRDYGTTAASLDDDVNHSDNAGGLSDLGNPGFDTTPVAVNSCDASPNDGEFCNKGTDEWMEDGDFHAIRIDIVRDSVAGTVTKHVYYDCDSVNCRNLTADYFAIENPADFDFKISNTETFPNSGPPNLNQSFNLVRLGFTMGDCGGGSGFDTTISDFGVAFR